MQGSDLGRTIGTVGVTIGTQVVHSMIILAVPVMLPVAAADLGVESRFAGTFTAIAYTACMVVAIAIASSVARVGALTVCILSTLVAALGIALFAGGSLAWTMLAAVVLGLGYGPITPATAAVLAGRVPPRWFGLVFSLKQTGVPIGFALAGLVVPLLVVNYGWQRAALILAIGLVLLALALLPFRHSFDGERPSATSRRGSLLAPMGLVLRHRQLRALSCGAVLFLIPQSCLGSFLVVFLVERGGLTLPAAGGLLAIAQAAGMSSRIVSGLLADRLAERFSILAGLAFLSALGATAIAFSTSDWSFPLITATCILYGAGAIGWNGVMLADLAHWSPPGQAAAVATAGSAVTYAGAVLGPAGFGLLVGRTGYQTGFLVVAAIALAAASWFVFEALHLRGRGAT